MNFEAYRTIAEISVALTGFIGIIVVLQLGDRSFSRLGVGTMMGTSVGGIMFAFLPDFLSSFLDMDVAWRIACGTFGIYHLFLILNHQIRQRSIRSNTPIQMVITLFSFPVVGLKLAVGFGCLLTYAYSIYYLGLLWLVGITAYLFTLLLFDDTDSANTEATSS